MKLAKKLMGMVLICSLALFYSACQNGEVRNDGGATPTDPAVDEEKEERQAFDNGVVMEKDEQGRRVLITQVVDNSGKPAIRAVWFTISEETELTDSRKSVLSFHDLEVGHWVEAWHTGPIRESFPEQGEAAKIVLLPEPDVPSGWVSRREAVKTALASAASTGKVWAVPESVPDREGEQWTVTLVAADDPENPRQVSIDATNGNIIYLQNDAFRVFQPIPSEVVGSSFTVKGKARVFEASFRWELEDGHNILAEGYEMADAGAPQWGNFAFSVRYEAASNPSLGLILFVNSPKDGSREHELIVPLKPQEDLIQHISFGQSDSH